MKIRADLLLAVLLVCLPLPLAAKCISESWGRFLTPGPQTPVPVEVIEHTKGVIQVYKFDALSGQFAKLYIFLRKNSTCFEDAVSVGSYATTNMLNDGPERLFHADYYTFGTHETLGFFEGPPDYQKMRALALETFR